MISPTVSLGRLWRCTHFGCGSLRFPLVSFFLAFFLSRPFLSLFALRFLGAICGVCARFLTATMAWGDQSNGKNHWRRRVGERRARREMSVPPVLAPRMVINLQHPTPPVLGSFSLTISPFRAFLTPCLLLSACIHVSLAVSVSVSVCVL